MSSAPEPPVVTAKPWPVRGYARVLVRSAWWNIFHLAVILIWTVLLLSEQGKELLLMYSDGGIQVGKAADARGIPAILLVPLTFFAVVTALGGFVVARAGAWQTRALSGMFQLDADRAQRISQIWIPITLGVLPTFILGLASDSRAWFMFGFVLVALVLVVLGWMRPEDDPLLEGARSRLASFRMAPFVLSLLVFMLSAGAVVSRGPEVARWLGTLGVAILALGSWSTFLSLVFVAIPLRFGVSSLAVLAPVLWLGVSYWHDPNLFPRRDLEPESARLRASHVSAPAPLTAALTRWILAFESLPPNQPIPIYLVTAEGGGIRAAYWTARVLAELDERAQGAFSKHVFAFSGVSGGSVGIAAFAGATLTSSGGASKRTARLEEFLGRDYLAPMVSRLLFTEPLWQLLGPIAKVSPRDVAFETQFAQDWNTTFGNDLFAKPFLSAFDLKAGPRSPALLINATNVEEGKRFVLSNVRLNAGDRDLYVPLFSIPELEHTMADVTVGEAVHLSARFPYVSPPASVVGLVSKANAAAKVSRIWGRVVDGGYFDNSGALAIDDILQQLLNLRSSASRADRKPPKEAATEIGRALALLKRATFHVIVIRNDPLAKLDGFVDIPTIHPDAARLIEKDATGDLIASHMPTTMPMSEVVAPPEAFVAARDARGMASRIALRKVTARVALLQGQRCEQGRQKLKGDPSELLISAECIRRSDQYREVSLSQEDADARHITGHLAANADCKDVRPRSDVALGWVLSADTRRLLSCLAKTSTRLDEILEPFALSAKPASSK